MSETQAARRLAHATRRLADMPPPPNKRKPWRVFGPGEHYEDRVSENKAYELVRSLLVDLPVGETVTVYVYEHGRWVLFEILPED